MIILIIIVIALLCIYISFLRTLPIGFAFLGAMVGCLIVNFIICGILGSRKFRPSAWQQKKLDEAEADDKRFAERNKQLTKEKEAEVRKQAKLSVARYEAELSELQKKHSAHCAALQELDILSPDEQKLDIVDQLIQLIESHRANSVSEALWLYDEKARRDQETRAAIFRAQLAHLEQQQRAQDDFNRHMEDLAHKSRMEELERKQFDELERMRKDDEYYRRYGQQL